MGSGGDFRHHAAKLLVQPGLALDHRGKDLGRAGGAAHHGGGGVVAAAFKAEKGERLGHLTRRFVAEGTGRR